MDTDITEGDAAKTKTERHQLSNLMQSVRLSSPSRSEHRDKIQGNLHSPGFGSLCIAWPRAVEGLAAPLHHVRPRRAGEAVHHPSITNDE